MESMQKYIRQVFWIFFVIVIMLVTYLGHFILIGSNEIINTTLNPRVRIVRENIRRGDILDINHNVIATSYYEQYGYVRSYLYNRAFAHVVGFTAITHTALEEVHNFRLTNLTNEVFQRIRNIALDEELFADSLVLTIDAEFQNVAYNILGQNPGTIIAVEPHTGRIFAKVSNPSFDPNYVGYNWSALIADTEHTPLLNRATSGLYPPGSVGKITTALAGIRYGLGDFLYNCTGEITIDGHTMRCYNFVAHGYIDMNRAFAMSCNTYFIALAYEFGAKHLIQVANDLYFNKPVPFELPMTISRFNLSVYDVVGELMQSAIGQGMTVATPLHMLMLTAAIANDGVMMEPFVVNNFKTYGGRSFGYRSPNIVSRLLTQRENEKMVQAMIEVVQTGTGRAAALNNIQIAGKTGTAENDAGLAHGWVVGFAPAENPQIAFVVMLENSGGTSRVLPMVRELMDAFFKKI